jgi:hypothetical protein
MSYIDNGSTNQSVPTNVVLSKGRVEQREVGVVASTAIEVGTFLAPNGSGKFAVASSSSVGLVLLRQATKATDADYASASKTRLVEFPQDFGVTFDITIGAGTFTTAMIGNRYNLASGGKTLSVSATGTQFEVVAYLSATRARVKICPAAL